MTDDEKSLELEKMIIQALQNSNYINDVLLKDVWERGGEVDEYNSIIANLARVKERLKTLREIKRLLNL